MNGHLPARPRHRRPPLAALPRFAVLLLLAAACTDAGLQPVPPEVPDKFDNLLRIEGQYCTRPPQNVEFPVKVLYILDQSASLQCTDSQYRRFPALQRSIDSLRNQGASFAFVGFSSWSREQSFTRNQGEMAPFLDPAGGLGPATDYQGALATAIRIIEQDVLRVMQDDRTEPSRTRYVIVFVSDGVPEPRCNPGCEDTQTDCGDGEDNDGDGRVDGADEDCADIGNNTLHPDNLYGVCNTDIEIPDDVYVDMTGICPEYNQPTQIMRRVQELIGLKETYSLGDVTLNTVLLFSPQPVVESICPGASTAFGYDKDVATAMLQAMAAEGKGVFRDVNLEYGDDSFLQFDFTQLSAEQSMFSFMAFNGYAVHSQAGIVADSDSDGISDDTEAALFTDRYRADTDRDRYRDAFELRFADRGFDAKNDLAPALPCPNNSDRDGDWLNDCEEVYLGTDPLLPDTDGDNLIDILEFRQGTDPLVHDALRDLDFDGVLNFDEMRGGTNPLVPDEDTYRASRVLYGLDDNGNLDFVRGDDVEQRHCYDFSVSRIQLVPTPLPTDRGLNRIFVMATEGSARVAGVPGEVRAACFDVYYQGDTFKLPASGVIDFTQEWLDQTRIDVQTAVESMAQCAWFDDPASEDVAEIAMSMAEVRNMISECLPPKIELDRRLLTRDDVFALLSRYIDGNLAALIYTTDDGQPRFAYEIFQSIQYLDPSDCVSPWQIERLQLLLADLRDSCQACAEAAAEQN